MESLNNEDEFCWPSLSHGTEGPDDDALKSDFKFSSAEASSLKNISDYNMDLNDNIEGLPILDCDKKPSPFDKKLGSEMDVDFDGVATSLSTFGESDVKSSITDDLMPKQKVVYPIFYLKDSYFTLVSAFLNSKIRTCNFCELIHMVTCMHPPNEPLRNILHNKFEIYL
jgi:hypothetical protein